MKFIIAQRSIESNETLTSFIKISYRYRNHNGKDLLDKTSITIYFIANFTKFHEINLEIKKIIKRNN